MRGETQALHLAKMMQDYVESKEYELVLPPVTVRRSDLTKLSTGEVILLKKEVLTCLLITEETMCAELVLKKQNDSYVFSIIDIDKKTIKPNDSKKYEYLKLSLGTCQLGNLEIGNTLDVAQFDLHTLSLIQGKNKIAEGSLVTVGKEIAVKINKVIR